MDQKTQIIRKAMSLFMQYGIKSVSMDDLSREMGISKKTLYQHFADKKELVNKAFETHILKDEKMCCTIMEESKNAIQQLMDLAKHLVETFTKLNPSTIFDIQKYYPNSWKLFSKHRSEFIHKQIANNLELGVQTGLYRKELDIEVTALLYISLVDAMVKPSVYAGNSLRHLDVFVQVFDYHLHAIMSDEGRTYFNSHKESFFN